MKVGIETGNVYLDNYSVNHAKIDSEIHALKQLLNEMYGKKCSKVDYICRLLREAEELCERIEKLDVFISSSQFGNLALKEQELMRRQSIAMKSYLECLSMRLEMKVDG